MLLTQTNRGDIDEEYGFNDKTDMHGPDESESSKLHDKENGVDNDQKPFHRKTTETTSPTLFEQKKEAKLAKARKENLLIWGFTILSSIMIGGAFFLWGFHNMNLLYKKQIIIEGV